MPEGVLLGVGVAVGVGVSLGPAAAVADSAAEKVDTASVLTAFASTVGVRSAALGPHAPETAANAISMVRRFERFDLGCMVATLLSHGDRGCRFYTPQPMSGRFSEKSQPFQIAACCATC